MIADLDSHPTSGLNPAQAAASSGQGSPGRGSDAQGCFGPGAMPTLEGLPRQASPPVPPAGAELDEMCPEVGLESQALRGQRGAAGAGDDFLLRLYLRDIAGEPRLQPAEETDLGWCVSFEDAAARQRLVLGTLRRVISIAFEYRGLGLSVCDLISEGNLGLLRATDLFDPVHGVPFSVYAATWVRQRMRRALSYQAWPMRLPADLPWQEGRVREVAARLGSRTGQVPPDDQLAAACGLGRTTVHRLRSIRLPCAVSLQSPVDGHEAGQVLADTLPEEGQPAPDEAAARRSDQEWVARLVTLLRPREQQVLRLRFGLDGGGERTLEEVGKALGYVRQGVHRIESAALARLRRHVRRIPDLAASVSSRVGPGIGKIEKPVGRAGLARQHSP
jgi:RNA polymerase primary sigma factor